MESREVLQIELAGLKLEQRDIDDEIDALKAARRPDPLRLQRLKKRRFELTGRIRQIKDQLTPDIIA